MKTLKSVLIMAGGTGGHVFPGLAVAKQMHAQGIKVYWLGTHKGLESRVVPEAGLPIYFISISGFRGKGLKDLITAPLRLIRAIWQSIKIIYKLKPDLILGMGGFVSGPGGIAGWILRRPIVIHEQNAIAGMTNTYLAKIAKKVLEGFPNTFNNNISVLTVGNPVRAEIANISPPILRFKGKKNPLRLLVVGGSLGALALNEIIPQALHKAGCENFYVVHQTGEKHFEKTKMSYSKAGIAVSEADLVDQYGVYLTPFIKNMGDAYAETDLVLCRAGALTIAELCYVGVGAILVPYPYAVDDHQTVNGNFMVKNNAAILVQQHDLSVQRLVELLKLFLNSRDKCITMAEAAYALRLTDATEKVVLTCQDVMRSS